VNMFEEPANVAGKGRGGGGEREREMTCINKEVERAGVMWRNGGTAIIYTAATNESQSSCTHEYTTSAQHTHLSLA